jgi:hypothetical protein
MDGASFAHHLIEPAVEPRQRISDAVGGRLAAGGRAVAPIRCRLCNTFNLPAQIIEAIVDGGEFVAKRFVIAVSV